MIPSIGLTAVHADPAGHTDPNTDCVGGSVAIHTSAVVRARCILHQSVIVFELCCLIFKRRACTAMHVFDVQPT